MAETEAEMKASRGRPVSRAASDDDRLAESLERFLAKNKQTMQDLVTRHQDLQVELASLLSYFGETPDGKVEPLLKTIAAFSVDLKDAAAVVAPVVSGSSGGKGTTRR